MKIYLVRWPGPRASLVAARNEDELLHLLDEVEDSEGATWSVYDGPLHISFQLPVDYHVAAQAPDEPLRPGEIVIDDVSKVEDGLELEAPGGETYGAMAERVMKTAFPHLHTALRSEREDLTEDRLRAAVSQELQPLVQAEGSTATRGRRTDAFGALGDAVDMSVRRAENVRRSAGQPPPAKPRAPAEVKVLKRPKTPRKATPKAKRKRSRS